MGAPSLEGIPPPAPTYNLFSCRLMYPLYCTYMILRLCCLWPAPAGRDMGAPSLEGVPPPAPACVPAQLFDDSPGAAELVLPLKGRRVGVFWRSFEARPDVRRLGPRGVRSGFSVYRVGGWVQG